MNNNGATSAEEAFNRGIDPAFYVPVRSQQNALMFLDAALGREHFAAVLQGPIGSGKSATARQLIANYANAPRALIDGAHLTARELLLGLVSAFGIEEASSHEERLLRALNEWLQQPRDQAPLLVIDDVHKASTSALRLVDWLAALENQSGPSLKLVMLGREPLAPLLQNDSLKHFANRKPGVYSLNPLSLTETRCYLRSRLIAAGNPHAEKVFTPSVCAAMHLESRGWPGALNRLGAKLLVRHGHALANTDAPRIVLTCDGDTLAKMDLHESMYVIGRSELADIVVNDQFASKMHAMLQVYRNALVLFDLNSTNGTTVNANEVRKTLLRTNDVISLGRHRIKVLEAPAIDPDVESHIKHSDTMTVKHLADLRRKRARRNLSALRLA
ncbi:MAG: FHA domain-containing protein [Pseudomonadota bacterium]